MKKDNNQYTNSYDPDVDYSALIDEAVKNGDLAAAGKYEQQRNEKIDALGLGYEKTNDYSQYYQKPEGYDPDVDYSALISDAAANKDYDAAAMYEQQRNDKISGEGLSNDPSNKYTAYGNAKEQENRFYDQFMNRDKFYYDLASDPLYQQYKDMYMSQGKLAMQDTMGQAAALTGGYGNSYAQTAGQQMYNNYLGKINDIVPDLYNAAYNRYVQEGNDIYSKYQAAAGRADAELGKIEQRADDAYNTALTLINAGIMPNQAMLNEAGIPWDMALNFWKIANGSDYVEPGKESGGSGGGTYYYIPTGDSGTQYSEAEIAQMAADYAQQNRGIFARSDTGIDAFTQGKGMSAEDAALFRLYLTEQGFNP